MPWRHEGRRVRITQDIDLKSAGLVRRGERGVVTYADRGEDIFDIKLDVDHPGLEDNLLCVAPFDDSVSPYLERDRISEATRFVRAHGAVMALGGFLVGWVVPSPIEGIAQATLGKPSQTRLMDYEGKLYKLTVAINPDGSVACIRDIEKVQEDEIPLVNAGNTPQVED